MSSEGSGRRKNSVRFSIDIERKDTSEDPFGINSATGTSEGANVCTSATEVEESNLSIDLGFLQPEAKYRAIICPVEEGTKLKDSSCDHEGVSACLSTDPAAGGVLVAACEVVTPHKVGGTVQCRLSMDLTDKENKTQNRQFDIRYQVMPPEKGHPSIKAFVHCIDKSSSLPQAGSGEQVVTA
eukprot:jgi/Ulvmu1/1598/UM111_0026.1